MWSFGIMELKRQNRSMWRQTYSGATLSVINQTLTGLGSNLSLRGERQVTNRQSNDTSVHRKASNERTRCSGSIICFYVRFKYSNGR